MCDLKMTRVGTKSDQHHVFVTPDCVNLQAEPWLLVEVYSRNV